MRIEISQLENTWGWNNLKLFLGILFFVVIQTNSILAQLDSSSIITEDVLDNILIEADEESESDELVSLVEDLIKNPIDLNTIDVIELSNLPYMDPQSAQKIIEHRNKFGYFYSPTELYAIRELDHDLIEHILPFVKSSKQITDIDSQTYQETFDNSESFFTKSKLNIRSRITNDLQNREGFTNNKYAGSKLKSYNRFLYNYDKNYQAGILIEKDPGELSYTDFSSFHLQIKDIGFVKTFIAGDYVLEYGQGLALWSPFGFSKGADAVYPVKKKARYLHAYTSAAEYRFFRGAATRLAFDNFNLTAFYSHNTFDAIIDSVSGEITSVGTSGFHRFESELNKKGAAQEKLIGGVLDYKFWGKMNVGVIYYRASFDKKFEPSSIYDLTGNSFNYLSTYYDLNFSKINIFGDASFDGTSVASVNGIQFSANRDFIFSTSVRSYPRNYNNLYGYGFSERSGKINNEVGVYTGIKWKTAFGILNLYYDIFKFPYRTSENSLSSQGDEILLDFVVSPIPKFEIKLRYKFENKEVTELIDANEVIVKRLKQIGRTEFIYSLSKDLRLKTRIEYNHFFVKDAGKKEDGFLVFQDVRFVPHKKINLYGRIIFFQTDSFNSAIYEFENDLLGVMPNLAMYGKGIRYYIIAKYKPLQFLSISAKYSETFKPDETTLSSGDNEIIGNVDNRFSLQVDLNF
jgi:hypothetical protein